MPEWNPGIEWNHENPERENMESLKHATREHGIFKTRNLVSNQAGCDVQ